MEPLSVLGPLVAVLGRAYDTLRNRPHLKVEMATGWILPSGRTVTDPSRFLVFITARNDGRHVEVASSVGFRLSNGSVGHLTSPENFPEGPPPHVMPPGHSWSVVHLAPKVHGEITLTGAKLKGAFVRTQSGREYRCRAPKYIVQLATQGWYETKDGSYTVPGVQRTR